MAKMDLVVKIIITTAVAMVEPTTNVLDESQAIIIVTIASLVPSSTESRVAAERIASTKLEERDFRMANETAYELEIMGVVEIRLITISHQTTKVVTGVVRLA